MPNKRTIRGTIRIDTIPTRDLIAVFDELNFVRREWTEHEHVVEFFESILRPISEEITHRKKQEAE